MFLRRLVYALAVIVIVSLFFSNSYAQETTAGLQGTVKDPTGAVVTTANVEVSGPALIGTKKVNTDQGGYYRFSNLPPGAYTLIVSAPNFRSSKLENIKLEVGKLPTLDVTLELGMTSEVVEVSGAAPMVDVAQSKVQTNITNDVLSNVPKGRSFQSVIQFAPGARNEPLQGSQTSSGGYQIDGASNSENSYLVEGQETASIETGASNTNVPMEFIQEVQVKSSGFEAEYGGALGGVVNVIQKRGSNEWHGSVFSSFRTDAVNAAPARLLRYNPQASANDTLRIDAPVEYFQAKKDHYRILDPGFEVGGYLLKDRLWIFGGTAPDIDQESRTVNFTPSTVNMNAGYPAGIKTFHYNSNTYYSQARVDFLASQKVRLFGSWMYAYQKVTGNSWPGADSPYGQFNGSSTQDARKYIYDIGFVAPNVIYNTGADITLTPNLVATSRFGFSFNDYQDRGLPIGVRYVYRSSNYPYSTSVGGTTRNAANQIVPKTALDGTVLPSTFALNGGFSNIANNIAYLYNKYSRTSFAQDLAYFKKAMGTHNLKVGYAFNRLWNDDFYSNNTATAWVAYGTAYAPMVSNRSTCQAITAYNTAHNWGNRAPGTNGATDLGLVGGVSPTNAASGATCTGLWGTINFSEYDEMGKASSFNHSLYAQDAWTIGHGVTLNLGVRFDKETVPSFKPGLPSIDFGFGQKVAPRLGGSWDVLGNGKLKVFGSYGWFYDIMKYNLSKGSFGGNYWHDCVYAMDTYDWTAFNVVRNDGHFCNPTGGANGTLDGLRFIENKDYRIYSNDPNAPGSLGPTGYIDPNLKPMRQHEYVAGADFALTSTLAVETRYSRKRLDRTVEDAGVFRDGGEQYYIVNPGYGVDVQPVGPTDCTVADASGNVSAASCPVQPKAKRDYDGLEIRLTKRNTGGKWFGSVSYTYSRLYGNYSGLTSTDVSDSGMVTPGRQGANADRNFDEPYMQFDSHGKLADGLLATDRPHTFKAYGYYRLKYGRFETLLGAFQQWYSGTPLSTFMSVDGAPVFVEGRGKWANITAQSDGTWVSNGVTTRRTLPYVQTDFSLVQEYAVSKSNEKLKLGFEANITNLFNQHSPVIYAQELGNGSNGDISPDNVANVGADSISGYDYYTLLHGFNYLSVANDAGNTLNAQYGKPYSFQTPRSFRFKIRFNF